MRDQHDWTFDLDILMLSWSQILGGLLLDCIGRQFLQQPLYLFAKGEVFIKNQKIRNGYI
jgi:hypothetical protein